MSDTNNAQSHASGKKTWIPLGVCAVVIVALIGVIISMSNRQPVTDDSGEAEPLRRAVLVTEDNVQEVIAELSQPVETPPSYRVRMSTTWHFNDGEAMSSDAYVANPSVNTTDVYFDLVLDSGETVLESPVIPIGASMRNMKLDTPLAAGRYPAVVVYHLIDENQETLSTVRMGVTLDIAH